MHGPPPTPTDGDPKRIPVTDPGKPTQPRWTSFGLNASLAKVRQMQFRLNEPSLWQKEASERIEKAMEKEARRLSVMSVMYSRLAAGRGEQKITKNKLDRAASAWWPSNQTQMKYERQAEDKLGKRDFSAIVAGNLLVSPLLRHYNEWLVVTEVEATRELAEILTAEMEMEQKGFDHGDAQERPRYRLDELAGQPATWNDGPSPRLLRWLGSKHLLESQEPLARPKRRRVTRARLFSSPALGARVLDTINEEDSSPESQMQQGGPLVPAENQNAQRQTALETDLAAVALDFVWQGFSAKDKIVLRKLVPQVDRALENLIRKCWRLGPVTSRKAVKQEMLQKLGEKVFAKKLAERAKNWQTSRRTRTVKNKGPESVHRLPTKQWEDILKHKFDRRLCSTQNEEEDNAARDMEKTT
ncbi:hypothetical protein BESB_021130 [Besnoitia besnoiti]|uniref:Uncharacterized protein n=1 Tax=Besnoitia besnoiti TaxID=94643 RepID=A0A2A9M9W9_BESBE|nr:hypothetical protein BESB_021130 [Besnoitia besnoiti]PFH32172.1 hypothetical protein BESB_021130 [Besnoitia besnoiti]